MKRCAGGNRVGRACSCKIRVEVKGKIEKGQRQGVEMLNIGRGTKVENALRWVWHKVYYFFVGLGGRFCGGLSATLNITRGKNNI